MTSLVLATRNRHKTREFVELLGPEFVVRDLAGFDGVPEVDETGASFLENALLKAVTVSRTVGGLVIADDSGLEVDSLGGVPGVRSARYAGEHATDNENVAKLLDSLAKTQERSARFRCVIAVAEGGQQLAFFDGSVSGLIARQPSGAGGFGYDPVFVPDGYEQTFAELGDDVKNQISHRARAVARLRSWLMENKKGGENRRP
ncbi:MAG TPA: RdgB/HAM1 family non-canonical purine NTP pyrophosphatase [Chthoniobacterales bacterium]